jgi:aquacobalamin reductase/NAD(P)H-flavin reductase
MDPIDIRLGDLQIGANLYFFGPFGVFTLQKPASATLIFVATGVRVASIRSMLHYLVDIGATNEMWLFFGAREESAIPYYGEFQAMARMSSNFSFVPIFEPPAGDWIACKRTIQERLNQLLISKESVCLYISSDKETVDVVRLSTALVGQPPSALITDSVCGKNCTCWGELDYDLRHSAVQQKP